MAPGCPNHGDQACGVRGNLRACGGQSTQQVEHDKPQRTHDVFDVVAEYPQEPHVAEDVQPAAVHEHRGKQRLGIADAVQTAAQGVAQGYAGAGIHVAQQVAGDQSVKTQRFAERLRVAGTLHDEPDERIHDNQRDGGVRNADQGVFVA